MKKVKLKFFTTKNGVRIYKVDEAKQLLKMGMSLRCHALFEGQLVKTSPIKKFVNDFTFITKSGSIYKIVRDNKSSKGKIIMFVNMDTERETTIGEEVNQWLFNGENVSVVFKLENGNILKTSAIEQMDWENGIFMTCSGNKYHFK